MSLSDLARESAIGTSVISSLRKTGLIIGQPSFPEAVLPEVTESHAEQLFQTLKLNESQQHIADQLGNVLDNGFSVHLIDGVPGLAKQNYISGWLRCR